MERILLSNVLPRVFADRRKIPSEVWLKQGVEFSRGEVSLVEAESGAGKTSLCHFIYGLRRDYQGEILFDKENIVSFNMNRWEEIRQRSLSFLFQDLRLFDELTAWENVGLKNDLTHFQSAERITDWFGRLGIAEKRDVPVACLSWGQKQRVALVRALCQPFDFLILDEPISHLDERNGMIFGELMMEEVRRQGAGVIATSIGRSLPLLYDKTLRL